MAKEDGFYVILGRRKSATECTILYDKKAVELFGEFALTNKKLGLY